MIPVERVAPGHSVARRRRLNALPSRLPFRDSKTGLRPFGIVFSRLCRGLRRAEEKPILLR